jgi:hypothetical protein
LFPLGRAAFRFAGTRGGRLAFVSRVFPLIRMNELIEIAGLAVSSFLLIYEFQISVVELFEEIFPGYFLKLCIILIRCVGELQAENPGSTFCVSTRNLPGQHLAFQPICEFRRGFA